MTRPEVVRGGGEHPSEAPSSRLPEPSFKRLTANEARHALYIDFEGQKGKPPVLLGILRHRGKGAEPSVFQVVVDPEFEPMGPESRGFREAVDIVVRRAERRDRRIVSWSQHDLEVVRRLRDDDPELVARFERRYANARSVAQRWVNKLHPGDKPADGQLIGYLALIGYEVPPDAGPGHVGETIRALRPTLRSGRPLTPNQQRRWGRLLQHNRYDCDGMRAVCLRATQELERARDSDLGFAPWSPPRRQNGVRADPRSPARPSASRVPARPRAELHACLRASLRARARHGTTAQTPTRPSSEVRA